MAWKIPNPFSPGAYNPSPTYTTQRGGQLTTPIYTPPTPAAKSGSVFGVQIRPSLRPTVQPVVQPGMQQQVQTQQPQQQYAPQYEQSPQTLTPSYEDTVARALQLQREANDPAIRALQAGIPNIASSYQARTQSLQGQIDPLKQRYQSLLDQIKGNQEVSTNQQTLATVNELGRRGILPNSGLGQQQLSQALLPVNTAYTGMTRDVGLSQEQDILGIQSQLAQIPSLQAGEENQINSAIAQLLAGGNQNAIQAALDQWKAQNQVSQFQANYGQKAQEIGLNQQELASRIAQNRVQNQLGFGNLGVSGLNAQTNAGQLAYQMALNGVVRDPSSGQYNYTGMGSDLEAVRGAAGGNAGTAKTKPSLNNLYSNAYIGL